MEWTGQRYADRPAVAAAAYIEAPPERVWALVSDIYLMPRLSAELLEVEWLDGADGPAVGRRFRGRNTHPALGSWETVSTIVACDEAREFRWAVGDPGHPSATWQFTLRPDGRGTLLEQRAQLGPGRSGLNLAIDAMPENEQKIVFVRMREFEAGLTSNLTAIRELAEGTAVMRTATTIEGSGGNWPEIIEFACEAEKLGLDICWVAEAWGTDAPSPLGYLAARTATMRLGSAVIQVGTRSPVLIAQTAMTLAHLSEGRFLLGLGVSGPQVMEGLHGVPFAHPLARMRETVQIVRSVFAGEKVSFQGSQYHIPLPGGEGRPMRVSVPPVSVPVYLAALSPKMLELTGELADGWLGTSFVPEGAGAYFGPLDAGLARAGRTRADLDICQGAEVDFTDAAGLAQAVASRKKELAFSLGGMGSASTNFYNDAYRRQGWAQIAAEVRARWQAGDRDGAAGLITDEMVLATTLIGTQDMVRARLRTWRDTGVDTVRLYPAGDTLAARLDNLARAIELVHALDS